MKIEGDMYVFVCVCLSTWTQKKTKVAMPHQLWREYMFGILAVLWKSNTATIPRERERASKKEQKRGIKSEL